LEKQKHFSNFVYKTANIASQHSGTHSQFFWPPEDGGNWVAECQDARMPGCQDTEVNGRAEGPGTGYGYGAGCRSLHRARKMFANFSVRIRTQFK